MKRTVSIILCIFVLTTLFGCYARQDSRDNLGGFFNALGNYVRGDSDDDGTAQDETVAERPQSPSSEPPASDTSESEPPTASAPSVSSPIISAPASEAPSAGGQGDDPQPTSTTAAESPSASTPPAETSATPAPSASPTPSPQPPSESPSPSPTATPPASPSPSSTGYFDSGRLPYKFTATDIYGNTVTEASLGDKQLFFVHYWATWCGPCLQEMPDLAQLAVDFRDSVGFIALLDDYDSNLSGAIQIVESAGIPSNFIMVDANSAEVTGLMSLVSSGYLPTTAIIDASGEMVIDQLVGAYGEFYATALDYLLIYGPDR